MDRQAYLDQAGVSDADWEQTPASVKRLVEVLIERLEYQEQQMQKMQADIEWLKEKLTRDSNNLSLPPSSDKEKRNHPKREKSGKSFKAAFYTLVSDLKMQSFHPEDDTAVPASSWKIKLLYDGQCPLCLREVHFLVRKDSGRGIVAFVDIADLDYNPSEHSGVEFAEAMGRIHAVLPDGTVIRDVEVFRRVYDALGMGWIYAATKWPVIRPVVDKLYQLWADWRLPLTGRPSLATLLAERQTRLDHCETGRCGQIPH